MSNLSDREAFDLVISGWKREIHNCFPAKVLAYDVTAQTVDVRPAIVRTVASENQDDPIYYEELPDIYCVPIQWPRGGGFALTFPLAVGDWVMVHCADNALHVWRQRGVAPSKPGINDEHGLNGCLAFPGCYPDKQRLTGVDQSAFEIRSTDGAIKVSVDSTLVTLGGASGAQFVALADLVQQAVDAAIGGHNHGANGAAPGAYIPPLTGCPSVAATLVRAK